MKCLLNAQVLAFDQEKKKTKVFAFMEVTLFDPKNCLESSLFCDKIEPFLFSSDFPEFRQAEEITLGLGYTPLTPATILQRSLASPCIHRARGKKLLLQSDK